MDEGTVGIIALVVITCVVAAVTHRVIRGYALAALVAAVIANIAFQIAAALYLGHVDPLLPVAVAVGSVVSFVLALIVGRIPGVRRRASMSPPGRS